MYLFQIAVITKKLSAWCRNCFCLSVPFVFMDAFDFSQVFKFFLLCSRTSVTQFLFHVGFYRLVSGDRKLLIWKAACVVRPLRDLSLAGDEGFQCRHSGVVGWCNGAG